jgi:AAA ATPase domain/Putative DNA-binding domain
MSETESRAGVVVAMTYAEQVFASKGLQRKRAEFFSRYPKARVVDATLASQENPTPLFFLAARVDNPDLRDVGFALGRLGDSIERQFLINGEVAFFFAPWRDFQRRSFNAMTQGLAELSKSIQEAMGRSERFTPSLKIVILISEDPNVQSKVEEWQRSSASSTSVISVPVSGGSPELVHAALVSQLRSTLGDRDLYRTQNPVTGDDFFGRQAMLRDASAALNSDENIAILGLRRSGKTSVLTELKRQMLRTGTIVTMADLQVLQSKSVGSLAKSISQNLMDDLRAARQSGLNVKAGDPKLKQLDDISLPELSDLLKRVANRNSRTRIVIAIDEIESANRIAKSDPEEVRTLLAALRAAAQACPNISLAFSGVANRMFRSTILGVGEKAVDNPMFGQVNCIYITAFDEAETSDLLIKLGRPMFLDWTREAVSQVQDATGGMPYFVRNLASAVRKSVKSGEEVSDLTMAAVTVDHLAAVLPSWREEASSDWGQLIEALRLHYPEAADLLEPSLSSNELDQWIVSEAATRDAADDLCRLGLLVKTSASSWRRTSALEAVHRLISDRQIPGSGGGEGAASDTEAGVLALLRKGEAHDLELKETFRINSHTGERDKRMETEIARAVIGFMNSQGGRLIVGVHDSGEIMGLERDLQVFTGDLDRFERWVIGDLLSARIDPSLVSQSLRLYWVQVRGVLLCSIEVQGVRGPAWLDDEHLYVRAGNQTLELAGRKLASFLNEIA